MAKIKNIIFDLDDTLFDTQGLLILPAIHEAFEKMVFHGLKASVHDCINYRKLLLKNNFREQIFLKISQHFGTTQKSIEELAQIGRLAFHKRRIKEEIHLFPNSKDVLLRLKSKFNIILLTIGDPATQDTKIHLLGLNEIFRNIEIVDIATEENKFNRFNKILSNLSHDKAESFVSIGNRIDTDVCYAKQLNMKGVLFEHGEYLHLTPQNEFETPDFVVKNLTEFERWLDSNAS